MAFGLLLVFASVAKVAEGGGGASVVAPSVLDGPQLVTLAVAEGTLGSWIASGLFARQSRWAGLAVYLLFSAITAARVYRGDVDCGCFGRLRIDPHYTLALDLAASLFFALWRPDRRAMDMTSGRFRPAIVALAIIAVSAFAFYRGAGWEIPGIGPRFEVVDPKRWTGRPLPIMENIQVDGELGRGSWLVVLYQRHCPSCQAAIPEYEERARSGGKEMARWRVALIEVPPYGDPAKTLPLPASPCLLGRLDQSRRWFVETPSAFFLRDGVVSGTAE